MIACSLQMIHIAASLFSLHDCRYAGVLFGITNTFSTLPGIIAPYVVSALTPNVSIYARRSVIKRLKFNFPILIMKGDRFNGLIEFHWCFLNTDKHLFTLSRNLLWISHHMTINKPIHLS